MKGLESELMSNIIEAESVVPLYQQLSNIIEEKINNEEYLAGSALPSEAKLCSLYGISRVTVRKAISDLVEKELLIRKHGKGTFVAKKKIPSDLFHFDGFTTLCRRAKIAVRTHILLQEKQLATSKDEERLGISSGSYVVCLVRLRYADEVPVIIEYVRLPYDKYKFLLNENMEDKSLYQTIARKTGSNPEDYCNNHIILECNMATHEESMYLKLEKDKPVFVMKETVISAETGEPVHFTKQVMSAEHFRFSLTSSNNKMDFSLKEKTLKRSELNING